MKKDIPTPLDNIKALYKQVGRKVDFINALSEANGREPITMYNHWFCRFWAIPKSEQQNVIAFMQKYIKQLNEKSKVV